MREPYNNWAAIKKYTSLINVNMSAAALIIAKATEHNAVSSMAHSYGDKSIKNSNKNSKNMTAAPTIAAILPKQCIKGMALPRASHSGEITLAITWRLRSMLAPCQSFSRTPLSQLLNR